MRLHVYHTKGKIIEGGPFNLPRKMTIRLTYFHLVKVQYNKSMLSTEIELYFTCG